MGMVQKISGRNEISGKSQIGNVYIWRLDDNMSMFFINEPAEAKAQQNYMFERFPKMSLNSHACVLDASIGISAKTA